MVWNSESLLVLVGCSTKEPRSIACSKLTDDFFGNLLLDETTLCRIVSSLVLLEVSPPLNVAYGGGGASDGVTK